MEAGRLAPSSWNSQPWKFIVIKNPNTIEYINNTCYYNDLGHPAPVMIALVVKKDTPLPQSLLAKYQETFMPHIHYQNLAMAALNMVYQAQSIGLDSAIKSPTTKAISKFLSIPDDEECSLVVCLGHKEEEEEKEASATPNERKELKEIVFFEKYGKKKGFKIPFFH